MKIEKYKIAIFIGIAGIMFYAIPGIADYFHSFFRLFVFLIGIWVLQYGYKLIRNKYPNETGQKTRWTIAFLAMIILLIALGTSYLYNPVMAYGVGLLLDFILVINIPRIATIYK